MFTIARQLRQMGFEGRLEVVGDLLPDQLPMLLESGVDVLEISAKHARRCDEAQWACKAAQWADQSRPVGSVISTTTAGLAAPSEA